MTKTLFAFGCRIIGIADAPYRYVHGIPTSSRHAERALDKLLDDYHDVYLSDALLTNAKAVATRDLLQHFISQQLELNTADEPLAESLAEDMKKHLFPYLKLILPPSPLKIADKRQRERQDAVDKLNYGHLMEERMRILGELRTKHLHRILFQTGGLATAIPKGVIADLKVSTWLFFVFV